MGLAIQDRTRRGDVFKWQPSKHPFTPQPEAEQSHFENERHKEGHHQHDPRPCPAYLLAVTAPPPQLRACDCGRVSKFAFNTTTNVLHMLFSLLTVQLVISKLYLYIQLGVTTIVMSLHTYACTSCAHHVVSLCVPFQHSAVLYWSFVVSCSSQTLSPGEMGSLLLSALRCSHLV